MGAALVYGLERFIRRLALMMQKWVQRNFPSFMVSIWFYKMLVMRRHSRYSLIQIAEIVKCGSHLHANQVQETRDYCDVGKFQISGVQEGVEEEKPRARGCWRGHHVPGLGGLGCRTNWGSAGDADWWAGVMLFRQLLGAENVGFTVLTCREWVIEKQQRQIILYRKQQRNKAESSRW